MKCSTISTVNSVKSLSLQHRGACTSLFDPNSIFLLEIILPLLMNYFWEYAGTVLFGTESLTFYIFCAIS